VGAYAVLILFTARGCLAKIAAVLIAPVVMLLMKGPLAFEAKVWGVMLMGVATLIFFLLPWLDQSPVKSIRYKGALAKWALAIFVAVFLVLGYLGTLTVTEGRTLAAQICTFIYFAFFLLMPWYTTMDRTRPEPARVTT
jgi:ubiquinol-cytochrome c reductase cytochrome b subunit